MKGLSGEQILTFLLGAGSAGTVVGSMILWRVKKLWTHVDMIPELKKSVESLEQSVMGFSGELKTLERFMYNNQKDVALTSQKADTAFRRIDEIRYSIKSMKL